MTISKQTFWGLLGLVAALQTAALGYMVIDRQRLLKTGREIALPVIPFDPRDIFRGEYVRLGYNISALSPALTGVKELPAGIRRSGPVWVTLTPAPEGAWKVKTFGTTPPQDAAAGDVVLKGQVSSLYTGTPNTSAPDPKDIYSVIVRYGIESFFLPEGTGKPLEDKVREHKISALIAVGPDGTAAIKGLTIDGERHEDPPLF
jgi:uncharacterized membrane-anchored protein